VTPLRVGTYVASCCAATASFTIRNGEETSVTLQSGSHGAIRLSGGRVERVWLRGPADDGLVEHICLERGAECIVPFLAPGVWRVHVRRTRMDRAGACIGEVVVAAGAMAQLDVPRGAITMVAPADWRLTVIEANRADDTGAEMEITTRGDRPAVSRASFLVPGRYVVRAVAGGATVWQGECAVADAAFTWEVP
jgi:hypothetical protein